jgi:hypothetical protein
LLREGRKGGAIEIARSAKNATLRGAMFMRGWTTGVWRIGGANRAGREDDKTRLAAAERRTRNGGPDPGKSLQ